MNANATLIEALGQSDLYRRFETAYSEAMGMPVGLRPLVTWQLPLHGRRHENPFCALVARHSHTCAACLQSHEKLTREAANAPAAITCPFGLCEIAVPLKLGGETIGMLQSGQTLRHKPTEAGVTRAITAAAELGVNLPTREARDAFLRTPVANQRKLDAATGLLSVFAEHLSIQSNQIAVQNANAEPPAITRAKQFIQEHSSEKLSLGQVASAVHTSLYYFCKLFHKATGVTFTEYVARTRAERAKNLLLNPHLRVSEIAYEAGFQSLTHFNRVFKRIAGESPTQYRSHLPRGGSHPAPPPNSSFSPPANLKNGPAMVHGQAN